MSDNNNNNNNNNHTTTDADLPPQPRLCSISNFLSDLTGSCRCTPSWRAFDTFHHGDGSDYHKVVDVVASFSPPTATSKNYSALKAAITAWKVVVLGSEVTAFWINYFVDPKVFFFAYLTTWALTFASIYSIFSLVNTLVPVASISDDGRVSTRTQWTWIFFTLAGTGQLTVSVLYWALVFPDSNNPPNLYQFLAHGVVFVLVWVDGLFVNRIPVRMRHWTELCVPVFLLWTFWSVMQSPLVFDIENPYKSETGYDHNRIYPVLDWENQPVLCVGLTSGLIFIFTFVGHTIVWGLSMAGRLYVLDDDRNDNNRINDHGKAADDEDLDV